MAGGAQEADDAITGINVTPLVDITLVLLIIFMVTTKIVLNQTVPLDLPKAATGTSDVQIVFSIILAVDGRASAGVIAAMGGMIRSEPFKFMVTENPL